MARAARLRRRCPRDSTYQSSSLSAGQVAELSGNRVRFTLQDETSFNYTVTVSTTVGSYTFSGTLTGLRQAGP